MESTSMIQDLPVYGLNLIFKLDEESLKKRGYNTMYTLFPSNLHFIPAFGYLQSRQTESKA